MYFGFIYTATLIFFLFLTGCQKTETVNTQTNDPGPISCDKPEYNPKEYTSQDLFFDGSLYISSFCQSMNGGKKPPPELVEVINKTTQYFMDGVFLDLDYDKVDEYIVKGDSPSGGTSFYFFQKQKNKWKVILTINGGFVLSPYDYYEDKLKNINKSYSKITNWSRSGVDETYQTEYVYINGKYEMLSEQKVPLVLLHKKEFLELMVRLNDEGVKWN